jgi:putative transcriptional regulator
MPISHHPPEDILAHYAAGTLSEAEHLVIAVHVAGCARCQRFVGQMEMLAAAALADAKAPPEPPGAFAAIMAEVDRSPRTEPQDEGSAKTDPELAELPEPLQGLQIGRSRWIAPGLTTRPILLTPDGKRRAFLLHGEPGTRLIQHTHTGDELTCVLKGSYTDHVHRFETGDLDFSDEEVEHELVVTDDGPCLCLIAMTGDLKLLGMLGWMMSPFIRL